jgi:hypothetical protein
MISNANFDSIARRKIELSQHAKKRGQQRGITSESVKLIIAFGEQTYDGKGGIRLTMTERAMIRLERTFGFSKKIQALAGDYVVIDANNNETVITVSHRYS